MSNHHKVTMFERNQFNDVPLFVTPPAVNDEIIAGRRAGPTGMSGREAERLSLLRSAAILKHVPTTNLKAMARVTDALSIELIGGGHAGLFIDETMGKGSTTTQAKTYKPASLIDLRSRDPFDPEQRPTSLDVLQQSILRLEYAAELAGKLVLPASLTAREFRQANITLGRLEASVGMALATWGIADEISYAGSSISDRDIHHLVREETMRQKARAVEVAEEVGVRPSVRQLAHEFSPAIVKLQTEGMPAIIGALAATSEFTLAR